MEANKRVFFVLVQKQLNVRQSPWTWRHLLVVNPWLCLPQGRLQCDIPITKSQTGCYNSNSRPGVLSYPLKLLRNWSNPEQTCPTFLNTYLTVVYRKHIHSVLWGHISAAPNVRGWPESCRVCVYQPARSQNAQQDRLSVEYQTRETKWPHSPSQHWVLGK